MLDPMLAISGYLRPQDLLLDTLSIYTIRLLSADMVDKAGRLWEASQPFELTLQTLILMFQHGQDGHFGDSDSGMYLCVRGFDAAFLSSLHLWVFMH